jgi:hypothetical protein
MICPDRGRTGRGRIHDGAASTITGATVESCRRRAADPGAPRTVAAASSRAAAQRPTPLAAPIICEHFGRGVTALIRTNGEQSVAQNSTPNGACSSGAIRTTKRLIAVPSRDLSRPGCRPQCSLRERDGESAPTANRSAESFHTYSGSTALGNFEIGSSELSWLAMGFWSGNRKLFRFWPPIRVGPGP